jgi:hypothetical protein
MDSAACSRSRVRQRPNGRPASAVNARASVRSLAPTSWPQSRSVRRSAGWARSASATRRAVTEVGRRHIQDEVLPLATEGVELGADLLELGPGPGAATSGCGSGSDSLPSDDLHQFHEGDTYNPLEPAAFLTRLQSAGFAEITLRVGYNLSSPRARRPFRDLTGEPSPERRLRR